RQTPPHRRSLPRPRKALPLTFQNALQSPVKDTSISTSTPTPDATNSPSVLTDKTPNISFPIPSLATPSRVRGPRSQKTFSSPVQAAALNADPEVAALLRRQRELERELRDVKEGLDVAEQARKIEAESRRKSVVGGGVEVEVDGELVELIGRWTAASRQAAEELFGQVRDKVNRMGGPRAWKEMQKKQEEFQNTWDQQDEQMNTGNGDDSDNDEADTEAREAAKKDLYAQYDVYEETENEKSQRPKGLGDTGERPGEEDEFTMAMMLRTLNVDLDIIGYDRDQQRWVD
ncbi:Swi5-dependent recombination DNA repair protein, partial [Lachnellula subtilissima]